MVKQDISLESLSDEELIERFKSLYHIVKIVECYSARDVLELIKIENELIKRGYTFREKIPDVVKEDIEWK